MRIRNILLPNPSEPPPAAHLPLHKGGFGTVQTLCFKLQFRNLCLCYTSKLCCFSAESSSLISAPAEGMVLVR